MRDCIIGKGEYRYIISTRSTRRDYTICVLGREISCLKFKNVFFL